LSRLPLRLGAVAAVGVAGAVALLGAGIVHALFSIIGEMDSGFARFVGGSAAIAMLLSAAVLRYFYVGDRWKAQLAAHARAEADALQARSGRTSCSTA
jgi:two-component system sensor histidine kinase AlgZ